MSHAPQKEFTSYRAPTIILIIVSALLTGANSRVLEAPLPNDQAKHVVDRLKYLTLEEVRAAGLEAAHLEAQPWSGWYWPLNEGGIASRYADPAFPKEAPWAVVSQYLRATTGGGKVSDLSPAEKYDLLLGDANFSLTKRMISVADDHAMNGEIEAWLGYCTGWANAAMMLPRPKKSVRVLGADGLTEIEFRPSDIKALGALLWSTGSSAARVVGTTCGESPVRRDPKTGRAFDQSCRDTNPATFHLTITNQIGAGHRSFLIDSDSGYQIWNHPVASYQYTYFHPVSGKPATLEEARVPLAEFENDPFKQFRNPAARTVVGIETTLSFVYVTRPDAADSDAQEKDQIRLPVYRYDLELDEAGRIVGGEWYTRLHPDVLWVSLPGIRPVTRGDAIVDATADWIPSRPLPASWISGALESGRQLQPLGIIVEKLFAWASE